MASNKQYKKRTVNKHRKDAETKYNKGAMDSPTLKVHTSSGGLGSFGVGSRYATKFKKGGLVQIPPEGNVAEQKSPGRKTGAKSDKDRDKSAEGIVQAGRRTLSSLSTPQMKNGKRYIKKAATGMVNSDSSANKLEENRKRMEAQKAGTVGMYRYKKGTKKIKKMESGVAYYTGRENLRKNEAIKAPELGGTRFFDNLDKFMRVKNSVSNSVRTATGMPDVFGTKAFKKGTRKIKVKNNGKGKSKRK